jgi:two-component system response regulator LytT
MKVLIIEDERYNAAGLTQMLREINTDIEVCEVLQTVSDSIEWLTIHKDISLIFMDIRLSDGLCFEIFDAVEVHSPIIFTTAYDEYAIKAFKVNSIDYLLKPINKEELATALTKYARQSGFFKPQISLKDLYDVIKQDHTNYRSRFLVQKSANFITVEVDEICFIYSEFKNTYLVLRDNNTVPVSLTLDEIEAELDPRLFFRANRQHIIKSSCIASIHTYFKGKLKVILKNNDQTEVIISKEKSMIFRRWLDR